jgi:hypothetical protein
MSASVSLEAGIDSYLPLDRRECGIFGTTGKSPNRAKPEIEKYSALQNYKSGA